MNLLTDTFLSTQIETSKSSPGKSIDILPFSGVESSSVKVDILPMCSANDGVWK